MPLFFIESRSVQKKKVYLTGQIAHRLRSVLRYKPGETIELADENRTRYTATIGEITPEAVQADIVSTVNENPRGLFSPRLYQAILKGKKMDLVIQKGTELGMEALVPVITERTIAKPRPERLSHQLQRWRKIALEAAQQCGRSDTPMIDSPLPLSGLSAPPKKSSGLCLFLWEQEKTVSLKSVLGRPEIAGDVSILTGPEGGFGEGESSSLREWGWIPVSLGPRILRAETAGMAVLAAIQYELSNRTP